MKIKIKYKIKKKKKYKKNQKGKQKIKNENTQGTVIQKIVNQIIYIWEMFEWKDTLFQDVLIGQRL